MTSLLKDSQTKTIEVKDLLPVLSLFNVPYNSYTCDFILPLISEVMRSYQEFVLMFVVNIIVSF